MIISAYLDESGIHEGSPINILGGLAGTPEQLGSLEREWGALMGADRRPVRGKWLYHGQKRFKGMNYPERCVFAHSASEIITKHITFSITAALRSADYEAIYRRNDGGRQLPFDSKYGVMFRMILSFLVAIGLQMEDGTENQVHIVLESGNYANTAQEIFHRFKREAHPKAAAVIKSVSTVDKKDSLAIQAADLHAYAVHRAYRDIRDDVRAKFHWGPTRDPAMARFQALDYIPYYEINASEDVLREFRGGLLLTKADRIAIERSISHPLFGDAELS